MERYNNNSAEELLDLAYEKYGQEEVDIQARLTIQNIFGKPLKDDFDAILYLTTYFTYCEWKEWIINNFLLD